ncbi:YncE family protein [Streptomyces sp. NBC_01799]|nr:YncE family protein [Streptomyces sp. NBC_01799]
MAGLAILAGLALPAIAPSPAWAASDSNAYVANLGSNNVSVIDAATNMVTATVTVGSIPFGVAITPDGLHAYVTNFGSGNVSVIATASNMVTATVTVGTQPNGVAISPISPAPSLTISKSHTGKFTQGRQDTYTITVDNTGPGATDGTTVNVHDTGRTHCRQHHRHRVELHAGHPHLHPQPRPARRGQLSAHHAEGQRLLQRLCPSHQHRHGRRGGDSTTHTATDPTTINRSGRCHRHNHHHHRRW